jgi:two-component system NtrC family sensor kinase
MSPLASWTDFVSRDKKTLTILYFMAVAVPLMVLAAAILDSRARFWADTQNDVRQTVAVLQGHTLNLFETQEMALDIVAEMIRDKTPDQIASAETSRHLAEVVAQLPQTVSIWISDARGDVVAASITPLPIVNIADRDYFRTQVAAPTLRYVGTTVLGRLTGIRVVPLSRRRPSPDGSFVGIIHVALSLDFVQDNLERQVASVGGAAVVLRGDGEIIARYPEVQADRVTTDNAILQAMSQGAEGEVRQAVETLDGVERLSSYRRLSSFPVYVAYGADLQARRGEWRKTVGIYSAVAVLCMALLLGSAWLAHGNANRREDAVQALQTQTDLRIVAEDGRQTETDLRIVAEDGLLESRLFEALGRMASGVAHDFNNILTVILGNIEVLEDEITDPQALDFLKRVRNAAETGAQLSSSLLTFARTQFLKLERVDVSAILTEFQPLAQQLATVAIEVTLDAPQELPCEVDAGQLKAAIGNLVVNARDASSRGGHIRITTRSMELSAADLAGNTVARPGWFVAIAVTDTGTGMTEEVASHVFEPFFTTKPVGSGSGLGLSQVLGFVQQLRGHVAIRSRVGEGTRITIYLPEAVGTSHPFKQAPEYAAPGEAALPDLPAAAEPPRKRILMVDDQQEIRTLANTMLTRAGYEVVTADGGAAALEALARGPRFHLLLSDIVMPGGIDGTVLARRAQALDPALHVLLISGFAPDASEVAGEWKILPKPFGRDVLLAAVRTALG